ncbi:MAG TPA: universal stress protein [Alphaproteobacteria bacterium]|nr:universal stress protein [Alphaproteobacteria bacterium]
MAFKDLLVHLDTSPYCKVRLALAETLARRFDAHLTGLYVMPPATLSPLLADQFPPKLLEEADAQVGQRRDKVEALFKSAVKALGAKAAWLEAEGDEAELVARTARHADLAILGQTPPKDAVPGIPSDFPERVVMGSGRPALLVPYAGRFKTLGERVLIAWNSSPQSARALGAALPFLAAARHIEVLSIAASQDEDDDMRDSGAAVVQYLSRHKIQAEAHHLIATDIGVGDMLLSRAADEAADLIVTGVYGHSRLRELVLGGVSRDLLARMTVPLLTAH